jgi:CNH domain
VFTLDSRDRTRAIPNLSMPHMDALARRLKGARALGIFRTFTILNYLLCYDGTPSQTKLTEECALFVDRQGEVCGPALEWRDKPIAAVVIDGRFVVEFSTSSIEIWHIGLENSDAGPAPFVLTLVQIICGHDIKMIGNSTVGLRNDCFVDRVYVAMQSSKLEPQVVVELKAESLYADQS